MDIADLADKHIEDQLQVSLSRVHRAAFKKASHTHCQECGTPIPAARRTAIPGVETCVECAEELEALSHRRVSANTGTWGW